MANPIRFEIRTDPRKELQRRLNAAPAEHAEAILAAFDLLESAHDEGLLALAHGAISSKDAVFAKIAEYSKEKASTNAIRNLLSLAKILGGIDPEVLSCVGQAHAEPSQQKAPSMWSLMRRLGSREGRHGLAKAVELLVAFGSSS